MILDGGVCVKSVAFAIALEERIGEKIAACADDALIRWVAEKEADLVRRLRDVAGYEPQKDMYPVLEADWAADAPSSDRRDFSLLETLDLLQLVWLMQKSSQFYQQAAANTPYPSQQLFFNSLSQWKLLLRKRLEGAARHAHSKIWSEIGFSPFPWEL